PRVRSSGCTPRGSGARPPTRSRSPTDRRARIARARPAVRGTRRRRPRGAGPGARRTPRTSCAPPARAWPPQSAPMYTLAYTAMARIVRAAVRPRRLLPRAERRAALLHAAARVFARAGFAHTSLEEIAAAAGVTRLIIYRHFDSKEVLYRAVLQGTF